VIAEQATANHTTIDSAYLLDLAATTVCVLWVRPWPEARSPRHNRDAAATGSPRADGSGILSGTSGRLTRR
jgi:hypothetical protein